LRVVRSRVRAVKLCKAGAAEATVQPAATLTPNSYSGTMATTRLSWRLTWTALIFLGAALLSGCASTLAPHNQPLAQYDAEYGYRFSHGELTVDGPSAQGADEVVVMLSFSGGGTRAAALAYGLLEELARTPVSVQGKSQRLLDQVEGISAVSGGSYTAAYYGLFGDRIFADFESRFLKRDIQREMAGAILGPVNLFRMTSPFFGRSDVAAEYLDRTLFEGKTFGDLHAARQLSRRPYIQINATDMARTSRFEFTQEMFDLLCSDLSSYSVSRAVVASSAVPVIFSPVTLKNYTGSCDYKKPPWLDLALTQRNESVRRYYLAKDLNSYLDGERRSYVHLLDGGLSDNLGTRGTLDRNLLAPAAELVSAYQMDKVRRFVQIVVNAQARTDIDALGQSPEVPTLGAIAFAISNTTDRYTVETLALLRSTMATTMDALRASRHARQLPNADDVQGYLVEVTFDALPDAVEREYFNNLPTSFRLPLTCP
jgi:NTE family protein